MLFSFQSHPTPLGAIPHVSQIIININWQNHAISLVYIILPYGSYSGPHPLGSMDLSLAKNLETWGDG